MGIQETKAQLIRAWKQENARGKNSPSEMDLQMNEKEFNQFP